MSELIWEYFIIMEYFYIMRLIFKIERGKKFKSKIKFIVM